MKGITYIKDFIDNPNELFNFLMNNVEWDERMWARKTASYGKAYNYSQMSYPYQELIPEIQNIINLMQKQLNFEPNNLIKLK